MKRFFSWVLILTMLFAAVGCSNGESNDTPVGEAQVDLMNGIAARKLTLKPNVDAGTAAVTQFGLQLAQASASEGENLLLSPLSVICALAMTANGADGETLRQMEEVFGLSCDELNEYLRWYLDSLPQGKNAALSVANGIWVNEVSRFTPNKDFLQMNADYYGAGIYSAPFDAATCESINSWVNEHTNGMIPEILDRVPPEALLYLVNALAFEARWDSIYESYQVRDGRFTKADGTEETAEFMYSMEDYYLQDEKATGFMKMYEDDAYAFVALLPNEGISAEEYLASLTGEELIALLNSAQETAVSASIPKFEAEYSIELSTVLSKIGMGDAFDDKLADFSGLGTSAEGNLYISRVIHKTFISVGEEGTKAGAATVVEVTDATGAYESEIKEVYLDRPFVYLLIDCETGLPFFIGILADVKQ